MDITRESVLKLMEEKEKIELAIKQLTAVLEQNNVGMNDLLVDELDFPRSDIDVYQVRQSRNRIICLQNDHKAIMTKIEASLHFLHAQQREGIGIMEPARKIEEKEAMEPIARINFVASGSPAEEAGISAEDLILEFGSVNASNFSSVNDIANVVQHSVGRPVSVHVSRSGKRTSHTITPKMWSGRGLLGCNIVPYEPVER